MAKMFYTAEEVAEKLGKTVEEVMEMANKGQIQEFRDRDKVMFKVDQIDLLTGDESEPSIPLALDDSGESFAPTVADTGGEEASEPLDLSGTGMTVIDSGASGSAIGLEDSGSNASGGFNEPTEGETSGLLDLTRESEETSLGAELLEEVYSSDDDNVELPAASSGLFEPVEGESGGPAIVSGGGGVAEPFSPMVASSAIEQLEPGWSGLAAGLLLGSLLGVLGAAVVVVTASAGGAAGLASTFTGNLWAWLGGLVGAVLVCGVAGFFVGRAID